MELLFSMINLYFIVVNTMTPFSIKQEGDKFKKQELRQENNT